MPSPFNVFMQSFTVYRKTGLYINGIWQNGVSTTFTILGDLQPTQANEMKSLPEGRRIDDTQTIYTETLLKSVDTLNPDIVLIDGKRYEVLKVYDWKWDLKHYKVIVGKCEQGL